MTQLIQNLRTKDDLLLLKEEIQQLKNALYQKDINYNDVLNKNTRKWVSDIIAKESEEKDRIVYFEEVENEIKNVLEITVAIAFEPSTEFIERLSIWLKTAVSERAIVDFSVNSRILGGIQISHKGKYIDLSLKKKVTNEINKLVKVTK